MSMLAKRAAYTVANRLPARLREPFLGAARGSYKLIGRAIYRLSAPLVSRLTMTAHGSKNAYPSTFRLPTPPVEIPSAWPEPPTVDAPDRMVRSIYERGAAAPRTRYDVELLEALNTEYAERPVVPKPLGKDAASRATRARGRLLGVHKLIDLADKRVLEIGCGAGYEVWYLAHHFGCEAYGVDVVSRKAWEAMEDERTTFECADMATANPFPADFFDRVISFTVLEHVTHPRALIGEMYRSMKPGALAWVKANLYRSAVGSHLYRDIWFPYPHLLFTDEVIAEFYKRRGDKPRGASWVNRLTWSQYERHFLDAGFHIRMLRFDERELDEEFYSRFEEVLGRYPRFDLTKDFFTVVLEKPA
jgi:SAM-dependent methyltransferase